MATDQWQLSARKGSRSGLNRRCTLVVDDEADSREALAILLSWAGHDVHVASDGAEALKAAQQYLPELIFLDIGMPSLDGYELCRRLRASPIFSHARIYALSGFSGVLHDMRCSAAGFTGQLTKPLDPARLQQLVGLPQDPPSRH
jgi:CheY-like chemotaxis protein